MAEHAYSTPRGRAPAPPPVLSAIAAALGEMEPRQRGDDMTAVHLDRQGIVFHASAHLPVYSSGDAALALSAAAAGLMNVLAHQLTPQQRDDAIETALRSLAGVASWVMTEHGGVPLASVWPAWASPFESEAARA